MGQIITRHMVQTTTRHVCNLLQDMWCKLLQDMWCNLLQDMWCKLLQNKRHFHDIAMKKRISALNNEHLLLNIEPSLRYLLHDVQVG